MGGGGGEGRISFNVTSAESIFMYHIRRCEMSV